MHGKVFKDAFLGLLEPGEHLSTRGPSKLSTAVLCRSQEEEQHRRGVAEADAEQSQTKNMFNPRAHADILCRVYKAHQTMKGAIPDTGRPVPAGHV